MWHDVTIARSGPGSHELLHLQVAAPTAAPLAFTFGASLLQLRGSEPLLEPVHRDAAGNILLWNGEIFGGLGVPPGANDGAALLAALQGADVPTVLSSLHGPWAAVYWHAVSSTLWFGRDVLGRRSLLARWPGDGAPERLILTSVVPLEGDWGAEGYAEVEPGLYRLDFSCGPIVAGAVQRVEWRDPEILAVKAFERPEDLIEPPMGPQDAELASAGVLAALQAAVGARCVAIDAPCHNWEARVMVLFSGGVDSTLLAALAAQALPPKEPIDLVSICFAGGTSPDRETALDALEELQCVFPARKWRLIGADRSLADVEAARSRLLRLLAPSDTVMDLNIGAALWLAAEGEGVVLDSTIDAAEVGQWRRSAARAVFVGHGADELFGGYGRHRTRFRAAGWRGLAEELALDVRRLWIRNLGRDDRLVADRGREARHPFLDESVVLEALKWPLPAVADLREPPGAGDKAVLRRTLCALGLPRAAARPKRAIQFGTRLAKAANAAQFGGTKRANARNAGGVRLAEVGGGGLVEKECVTGS